MLPWQFFSSSLNEASNSLVANSNLISKIYFPRLLVPLSSIAVNLVDIFISFALLFGIMFWYAYIPSWKIICILPLTLLSGIVALGPGLLLCALNVTYRDFRYVIPFITQFGLYISPVGFSSSIIPEQWRLMYEMNPMVGIIDAFRWAILGNVAFPFRALCISCIFAVILIFCGVKIFRKVENNFADVI
jgi:lipopolysaccharide transport system permease protein